MATAPRTGLTKMRNVGSAPESAGLTEYTIASGYSTALGVGDPVKLTTDGSIIKATNGADAIGVFMGVSYINSSGEPKITKYWPASATGTDIKALVLDDPKATFTVKGDGPIPLVQVGDIFACDLTTAADSATGRSRLTALVIPEIVGDVDLSAVTDLGEQVTGMDDGDAFTIDTNQSGVSPTTITITDGWDYQDLLDALNAVTGITASLQASTGFLKIRSTNGYDITMASTSGAPIADLFVATSFTGESEVVAANAGLVKVVSVPDRDNYVMEVVLVNHSLRDDG